jgi:hypothetical protein
VILHIAAAHRWDIQQVDIKTAFLNTTLPANKIQYTRQPKHFEEARKEGWVWKLLKSLYGLKQSGHIWNCKMHNAMIAWGFWRLLCEWCIYIYIVDDVTNLVAIHIDNMICTRSTPTANTSFKEQLRSPWEISDLGKVKFCLGISIVCDAE